MEPHKLAEEMYRHATPILRVKKLGGLKWRRYDAKPTGRTGPWFSADYDVLDRLTWEKKQPCIYFVAGKDGVIRYTGISRNGVKDRWREATAIDHATNQRRPRKELHHSQCWRHIEEEYLKDQAAMFEVRVLPGERLVKVLNKLGPPLSGFLALGSDYEGITAAVERWMCNNQSDRLVTWNRAMTSTATKAAGLSYLRK